MAGIEIIVVKNKNLTPLPSLLLQKSGFSQYVTICKNLLKNPKVFLKNADIHAYERILKTLAIENQNHTNDVILRIKIHQTDDINSNQD